MSWVVTHRLQDLTRSKHTLAEGKTLEEVTILSTDDFIGVTQNLRVVKYDRYLFGLQNQWIIRTWFVDKRNSAMLVRMTEC